MHFIFEAKATGPEAFLCCPVYDRRLSVLQWQWERFHRISGPDPGFYIRDHLFFLCHTKKGTFTVKEIDKEHEEELNKAAEEAYDQPMIALTFDDGPGKYTSKLLDALEQYGAHATFFMVGKNVPKYPEEVKRMLEIGCELGNHSYDHAQLTKLTPEGIQGQVNDTNGEIEKVVGKSATLLRPPYGAVDDNVKQNVGMPMILWSVDTLDWKTKDVNATIENVLTNAGCFDS